VVDVRWEKRGTAAATESQPRRRRRRGRRVGDPAAADNAVADATAPRFPPKGSPSAASRIGAAGAADDCQEERIVGGDGEALDSLAGEGVREAPDCATTQVGTVSDTGQPGVDCGGQTLC